MLKVFLGDVIPGMTIGQSIYSRDNKFLLTAGTTLTAKHVKSLNKWGIPAIYIDLGFLGDKSVKPMLSPETRQKTVRELESFLTHSEFASHLQHTREMEQSVATVVDELLGTQCSLVNLAEIRRYDDYLLSHSLDVCVLSVVTAVNLGWSKEKIVQLGLAALMHDVGKVRVPRAILMKPGPLDPEEFSQVQKHPLYALDILKEEPAIMEAASQHHENMDGSGYPYGLQGGAISEFARIIAIADLFDAMTTDRVYRRAIPVNEVLELIYASGGERFDLQYVRSFVHSIAAYPVGSVVELNDESVGIVVENVPGLPLYPRVRILQGADRQPSQRPKEIELGQHSLSITRLLAPAESFILSQRLNNLPLTT
ncbi:MAG TPA: HD-GYP domain-containing protein [Spirochaetia bacterium]|nr:HD-GYP domain-containing protein [Spirochaetia bacterium]